MANDEQWTMVEGGRPAEADIGVVLGTHRILVWSLGKGLLPGEMLAWDISRTNAFFVACTVEYEGLSPQGVNTLIGSIFKVANNLRTLQIAGCSGLVPSHLSPAYHTNHQLSPTAKGMAKWFVTPSSGEGDIIDLRDTMAGCVIIMGQDHEYVCASGHPCFIYPQHSLIPPVAMR